MRVLETVKKKLNVKFSCKSVKARSESEKHQKLMGLAEKSGLSVEVNLPVSSGGCHKRKSDDELVLPVRMEKRRRMDPSLKLQCGVILKTLMTHPYGFVFNKPVDPVALKIPDYFTIISHPMDFGTIKSKLDDNLYFSAEEFAADVRLTFSNALLYNPPDTEVYQIAADLECIFKSRWKLLEAKRNRLSGGRQQGFILNGSGEVAQNLQKTDSKKESQLDPTNGVAKKSFSLEESQMLKKEVMGMLRGKMTEKLRIVLKKFGYIVSQDGQIDVDISAFDVATLLDLKRVLKGYSVKAMPTKPTQNGLRRMSEKLVHKDACYPVMGKPPVSSNSSKSCSSGVTRHYIGHQTSNALSSSNGHQTSNALSCSDNSVEDHCHSTKVSQDSELKITSTHASILDLYSDGSVSVSDEENTFTSPGVSAPVTSAVSSEGLTSLGDDQWSMKKALRAAMLKSRFAETIIKANGDISDPRKMRQERERLERLQREEEARIKARMEDEKLKLKMQRESEREAARILLEKMERTVDLDDNRKVLRQLEMFGVYINWNPLEQLGLYLKEDYVADDDEDPILNGDTEEGEILQ